MSKKNKKFNIGDILIKKNHLPFGRETEFIAITVNKIDYWTNSYVINELYKVTPESVNKITYEEKLKLQEEWDSIGISEYIDNGNDPCIRLETGNSKELLPERHIKGAVFRFRHKYNNPAYEAYRCPKCGNLHLGKNKLLNLIKHDT